MTTSPRRSTGPKQGQQGGREAPSSPSPLPGRGLGTPHPALGQGWLNPPAETITALDAFLISAPIFESTFPMKVNK